jgi:hypothetical protein
MTFKPAIWYPITLVLSGINLAAAWFAAQQTEPWHATTHAALALAFGLWAQRLRQGSGGNAQQARLEAIESELSMLRQEQSMLRQELGEAQERLDFTERLLAQGQEVRRVDPPR